VPLASEDERYGQVPLAAGGQRTLLALVGHEARKVLTSRDGGHGWTSAATGLEGRYPAVRGLAFADHRTGWAVAGRGVSLENGCVPPTRRCDADGALLVATSAGATWSDATPTQHGQVVEVQDTVGRHPVIGREQDLRRYPRIRLVAGTPVTLLITGITACLVSTRNGRRPLPGSSTHHTSPRSTRGRSR
jgi:hypothetical protein